MSFEDCILPPPRSSRRNRRIQVITNNPRPMLHLDKQYHAVSYKEIMSVQNRHERMALYERTFELCMRADPKLSAWIKQAKQRQPPVDPIQRRQSSETHRTSQDIATSTFRKKASLSILLRKASLTRSSASAPVLQDTPKSSASRFISTSISRISSTMSKSRPSSSSSSTSHSSSTKSSSSTEQQSEGTTSKIRRRLSRQLSTPRKPFIIHPHINAPVDATQHQKLRTGSAPANTRRSILMASRPPRSPMVAIRV